MRKADYVKHYWLVPNTEASVRVVLEDGKHNIYTYIERREITTWVHVKDSSRGHGDDRGNAAARVEGLLDDGWKRF